MYIVHIAELVYEPRVKYFVGTMYSAGFYVQLIIYYFDGVDDRNELRFNVKKRSNGQPFPRIVSERNCCKIVQLRKTGDLTAKSALRLHA